MTSNNDTPWLKEPEPTKDVEFVNQTLGIPYTKEEVEDEVLEAVEEAKDEVPPMLVKEYTFNKKVIPPTEKLKEINDKKPKYTVAERQILVKTLRKVDSDLNHTCMECMRRLPIDSFPRHKRSEVCEDCEK